ncbi:MAG: heme-binding domain-containing protein [Ignavibacteriae bacterium]|nr:heme-binding domain-containing protein [Ignavibacteriota bacterium]
MKSNIKSILKIIFFGLITILIIIQFLPIGKNHTNPPVMKEPQWDTPQTRATFIRACADCHSNETKWPWYSNIAPVSWLIQDHVDEGREHLNISEWGMRKYHEDDAVKEVEKGAMPLEGYLFLHSEAKLTQQEKEEFIQGLKATFGSEEEETEHTESEIEE